LRTTSSSSALEVFW